MKTSAHSTRAFTALETTAQLDALVAESNARPVAIFKHSPTCGTSAQAFDELEAYLQAPDAVDVHLVDVLRSRPLSQAIAATFGVRHESPQLLLLVDGQVGWNGSHWRVNGDELRHALRATGSVRT